MKDEMNTLLNSLDEQNLTDEEIELLKEDARKAFDNLQGINFENLDNKNDDEKLDSELKTSKSILKKNIDRIEKLTNMLTEQLMMQPENPMIISNLISMISEQSKSIKLIHELDNKSLINKQQLKKVNGDNAKKKGLPPGLSLG